MLEPRSNTRTRTAPWTGLPWWQVAEPSGIREFAVPENLPVVLSCPRVVPRPTLAWRWITPDRLCRYLDGVARVGFCFVDLHTFAERLEHPPEIAPREVLLTFEDPDVRLLDLLWPELQTWDVRPVLFIRTAQVGRSQEGFLGRSTSLQLNWSELRFLAQRGASIQSRGHYGLHPDAVAEEIVFGDLLRSRRELEKRLASEAVAIRYPGGRADPVLVRLAELAGFQMGFASGPKPPFDHALALGSLDLRPVWPPGGISRRLAGFSRPAARVTPNDRGPGDPVPGQGRSVRASSS